MRGKEMIKLPKIRYNGVRGKGTIVPRVIWRPGDVRDVNPQVVEELLRDPDFTLIKPKKKAKKKK